MAKVLDDVRFCGEQTFHKITGLIVTLVTSTIINTQTFHETQREKCGHTLFKFIGTTGERVKQVNAFVSELEQCSVDVLHSFITQLDDDMPTITRKPQLRDSIPKFNAEYCEGLVAWAEILFNHADHLPKARWKSESETIWNRFCQNKAVIYIYHLWHLSFSMG